MQTPTDKELFNLIKETYPLEPRTNFVFNTEVELRKAAKKLNSQRGFKWNYGIKTAKSESQKKMD